MGIFDKVRVPLAFKGKNRFPLSSTTVTTSDWFTLRPVFSRELPPNSSISMKQSFYCRLSGLQKPMFGTGRVVNRAFFVPYNSIMEGFVDFIDDTNSTFIGSTGGTRLTHVPYAYASDVVIAMSSSNCFTNVTASDPYDVAVKFATGYNYKKFTFKGRQIYSIFTGLGISLSFYGNHSVAPALDQSFSLMKVLAYCKIVADWYFNNNFYERANQVLSQISAIAREPLSPGSETLQQRLADLFNYIYYSVVDNDYFSTATVNPVTPTGASQVVITDPTVDASGPNEPRSKVQSNQSASMLTSSTPSIMGTTNDGTYSSYPNGVTQFVVNALAGLTSYMQRNNIVGHKAIDRMLARFGVKLDNDLINRSYYLGSNSADLSVDEVMSNADTDGAALGAYAGRGETGRRDAEFHFDNDSKCFGVFIILSTIIPDVHYGQGITRDNLHINRLDFLTPEFDSLGPQAIARAELYYDAKTPSQFEDMALFEPGKSFGFQHTYCEYCKADDILSGDFRRLNTLDIRAFHMFRMFNEQGVEGSPLASNYKTISEQFVHANPSEFNKIFNYTDIDYDHFYLVHKFRFNVVQPKVPLVDTYEFHGDNEGRSIKVDLNGTKLN